MQEMHAMNLNFHTASFDIGTRDALSLWDAQGSELTACRGSIWITQTGDRRDIVLAPGESILIERPGHVVVSALDASARVFMRRPAPARAPGLLPRARRPAAQALFRATG